VEDTKGNNGERGDLLLTNLRLLWVSKRQRRTNISVGYGCITSIVVKDASSRLKGRRRWPSPAR
jgi:Bardet-Biedl syndrome 5 protein